MIRTCFWGDFGRFFANSGHFCGQGATLSYKNPLFGPTDFPQGHLLKTEWLVANVTPGGAPDRERNVVFWG